MKHVMIWLIGLYRKFISPIKPACCRFTPTCSAYAIEAFSKRGFFAGFILTVWRILRCNPFCKGGYDPVPERGFRRVKNALQHTETENAADKITIEAHIATDGQPDEVEEKKSSPEAVAEPPEDITEAKSANYCCGATKKEKEN